MTNLRAVWLVATQEIRERLRARSFLIITGLIVLMSVGGVVAADLVPSWIEKGPKRVGVVESAGAGLSQDLAQSAEALGVEVKVSGFNDRTAGETALRDGDIDARQVLGDQLITDACANLGQPKADVCDGANHPR